jgi:hypothetical protein
MFRLTSRRSALVVAALALTVTTALAIPTPTRGRAAAVPVVPAAPVRRANPLLPAPVDLSGLYPDLAVQPKAPNFAPSNMAPLYTQADWDVYRQSFGNSATPARSAGSAELAAKLIAAAEVESRPGLRRLLLIRAIAVSYRNRDGWTFAGRALESYRKTLEVEQPAQVAALWTIADTLSRCITTPRPQRIECSSLAAKANVQLSLQLVELGQIDAAQTLIKKATYHEGWVRSDTRLRGQVSAARSFINSSAKLMDSLVEQYTAVVEKKDEAAAFRLYLFARFVRNSPGMADDLTTRRNAADIQQLATALAAADKDTAAAYAAAELLRDKGGALPDGILRQRTLYAAMHYYRVFLRDPANEDQRVQRTLAQMQIQALAADGGRGNPVIRPFDPPPATQATTEPATRPAGPARVVRPAAPARDGTAAHPLG